MALISVECSNAVLYSPLHRFLRQRLDLYTRRGREVCVRMCAVSQPASRMKASGV